MNPIFQFPTYLLKRQAIALTGKFRFYDPAGRLVLFSEQKMFRLREDIRVYDSEDKSREVLSIQARQIMDFSAAYDVFDTELNQKVGVLRRKGLRSILRDEWEVLDADDRIIGQLFEDSVGMALLRRFLLGSWLRASCRAGQQQRQHGHAAEPASNPKRFPPHLNISC